MRRAATVLVFLIAITGCHNALILSGGGFRPIVILVPPTPEMQCVALALQKLLPEAQHKAIKQCEEEEDQRQKAKTQ
jgi:hypothetical protein